MSCHYRWMTQKMRRATAGDEVGIAEAHVASWQAAYIGQLPQDLLDNLVPEDRVDGWRQALAQPDPTAISVAISGSTVAGFAAVGPARDNDLATGLTGELMAIYVRPEHWDSGVGRRLMHWSLDHLTEAGFTQAVLWVLATNHRAIRFYQQGGWVGDHSEWGTKEETIGGQVVQERRYLRSLGGPSDRDPTSH